MIRPAASLVVLRHPSGVGHQVLMGRRGEQAAFMPAKHVFPGGGVEGVDHAQGPAIALSDACLARLTQDCPDAAPPPLALARAALREFCEETGLKLATDRAVRLRFLARAITPPGRTRRFDARFFLMTADALAGDCDDFRRASGELTEMAWHPVAQARRLNLPLVTELVLAEAVAHATDSTPDEAGVPFFDGRADPATLTRLR